MSETSVPQIIDPQTGATDAALVRALAAERDYVDGQLDVLRARLDGMDRATEVLHETVTRTPTEIQQAVGHLRELVDEKFDSVASQFRERDTRSERESRDNKVAVDAAFAAQKEAAAKQDESNSKAIEKSETATAETISKLQDLFQTKTDAQQRELGDLKLRVERAEASRQGAVENRSDSRAGTSNVATVIASVIAVISFLIAGYSLARSPSPVPIPAQTVTVP